MGPGTAAKPERGLGRDQKRGLTRNRHEDEQPKQLVFYGVFAHSGRAKRPKTLYFTVCSRPRERRRGQKPCILQCFRAFGKGEGPKTPCILHCVRALGKGEGAKNLAFYNVFAPSGRAKGPNTLYLQCFRAFGKGEGAKNLII